MTIAPLGRTAILAREPATGGRRIPSSAKVGSRVPEGVNLMTAGLEVRVVGTITVIRP
jgi:hypothetical protein